MLVGAIMVDVIVLMGKADVLFTSYPPLKAHPLYYLGIILFAVGALMVTGRFFAALVMAKREKTYEGSRCRWWSFGALTAAIIAVITLVHGAAIYIPTFPLVDRLMTGSAGLPHDLLGARAMRRSRSTSRRWFRSGTCSRR
jgi:cytochrome c oxidase subunit 1